MPSNCAKELGCTPITDAQVNLRQISQSKEPSVFADIYRNDVNLTTWQRDLTSPLKQSINDFLELKPNFKSNLTVTPQDVSSRLYEELGSTQPSELVEDISELVDLFCYLLEITDAGLRLRALDRAMCPKFHVDRVPCRLITTYQGVATQWLPHHVVDRAKLGMGGGGLPDSQSGIYQHPNDIQELSCGDVALLKGEAWVNNENAGLVHRSPALAAGEKRLILTLDVVS